jgi:hypothetical protein
VSIYPELSFCARPFAISHLSDNCSSLWVGTAWLMPSATEEIAAKLAGSFCEASARAYIIQAVVRGSSMHGALTTKMTDEEERALGGRLQ